MTVTLKETRHTTILRARVKAKLKRDANHELNPDEAKLMEHRSASQLFRIALTRPFRFLFTEAIVIFCALFNGYLYGLSFLFNEAFSLVFGPRGHGFTTIQVGLAFLGIVTGISLGPLTNLWQERYYQRRTGGLPDVNIPEARVQLSQVAAVGMSGEPLTSISHFPWLTKIFSYSSSHRSLLVLLEYIQDRTLYRADHRICILGMEFLHTYFDDIYVH